ncbi:Gfo/Idh/MocA family protein [Longispora urticae]
MSQITIAIVGAGSRGGSYANWVARHPEHARVVAVAEPRVEYRDKLVTEHDAEPYADWREIIARGERIADAVAICTQDADHLEPALAFAAAGYHILLEKPLAPTEDECRQIVAACAEAGVMLAVCHVLRYTPYTALVKHALPRIGKIVSVQHLEPVGFWHQAHSFVRGNWRNTAESTFMLLQKSCHDIDWLQYVVGASISRVSSFGGLAQFTRENQPAGAADRCTDCALTDCSYDARKIYHRFYDEGKRAWPLTILTPEPTRESLDEALREGPYGRCVYACDNDVVDHQVVALEFEGGASGVFTMTAFNEQAHRKTRIFGTHGELDGDGETVRVFEFATRTWETVDAGAVGDASASGGHGGGDDGIMAAFTTALRTGDPTHIRSGGEASLNSHLAVFAAERARLQGTVETIR